MLEITSELERFLVFGGVGVVNSLVDIVTYLVLIRIFSKFNLFQKGFLKITTAAHVISFSIANTSSYLMNSKLTFADSGNNNGYLSFFSVSLVSLVISSIIIQKLTSDKVYTMFRSHLKPNYDKIRHIWGLNKIKDTKNLFFLVVKLVTILVVMLLNYVGYQVFVF